MVDIQLGHAIDHIGKNGKGCIYQGIVRTMNCEYV